MSRRNPRAPVIPFEDDLDESKLEYIKHERTTIDQNQVRETVVERVPKLSDDATPHEILRFLAAFDRVRENMGWTTGAKLFQRFPMHLNGYFLDVWELLIVGVNPSVNAFNNVLVEFKRELLEGYSYEEQMDYLRELKKPPKMEPGKFLLKFRYANQLATQLPDAPNLGGFNADQFKRQYLHAMPRAWQDNFENANMTIHNCTIQQIRQYMDRQHMKDPFVPRNKPTGNNNSSNSGSNNSNSNNCRGGNSGSNNNNQSSRGNNSTRGGSGGGGSGGGGRTNNNRNNNSNNNRRIQPTDPCPLPGHGNHTWAECCQNRYGNHNQTGGQQQQQNRYNLRSCNNNQGQQHNVEAQQQNNNTNGTQGNQNNDNQSNKPQQGTQFQFQGESLIPLLTLKVLNLFSLMRMTWSPSGMTDNQEL